MKYFVIENKYQRNILSFQYNLNDLSYDGEDIDVFIGKTIPTKMLNLFKRPDSGSKIDHILPTYLSMPMVVSHEFKQAFVKNNISGISFLATHHEIDDIGQYYFPIITGRIKGPPVWDERNLVTDKTNPRKIDYKGLFYDFNTWNNMDVFIEQWENGMTQKRLLVNEKVKSIISELKIKSFKLTEMENYLSDKNTIDLQKKYVYNFPFGPNE